MTGIFKSRKAVIGLLALVFYLLIAIFPQTRDVAEMIAGPVVAIVAVVVLGIAGEDAVRLWSERPPDASGAATDVVEVIMEELMRLLEERQQQPPQTEGGQQPQVLIQTEAGPVIEGDGLPPADG